MNKNTKHSPLRLIGLCVFAINGFGLAQTLKSETIVRSLFGLGLLLGLALFVVSVVLDKPSQKRCVEKNAQGNNPEGKQ